MGMVDTGETKCKAYPPIRRQFQQEGLWEAVHGNDLMVTSGHMPVDPELKDRRNGDFYRSMPGINSLEYFLPALFTEMMVRERIRDEELKEEDGTRRVVPILPDNTHLENRCLKMLPHYVCVAPSKLLGIEEKKGSIVKGLDADFCIWDPSSR